MPDINLPADEHSPAEQSQALTAELTDFLATPTDDGRELTPDHGNLLSKLIRTDILEISTQTRAVLAVVGSNLNVLEELSEEGRRIAALIRETVEESKKDHEAQAGAGWTEVRPNT